MRQFFWLAVEKRTKSSVKKRCEKAIPHWEALTGSQSLASYFFEMKAPRISMQRIKRYGDKGSSCQMPLKGWKGSSAPPLNKTKIDEDVTQLIIKAIRLMRILKRERVSLINFHSRWSYAFSKSS